MDTFLGRACSPVGAASDPEAQQHISAPPQYRAWSTPTFLIRGTAFSRHDDPPLASMIPRPEDTPPAYTYPPPPLPMKFLTAAWTAVDVDLVPQSAMLSSSCQAPDWQAQAEIQKENVLQDILRLQCSSPVTVAVTRSGGFLYQSTICDGIIIALLSSHSHHPCRGNICALRYASAASPNLRLTAKDIDDSED
ncbi:hypothetical protein BJV77DRAFT_1150193 [Russula vinacea]|nr:hypothetical protein BJV77DRAFT_1150193 [Russula vinacea]